MDKDDNIMKALKYSRLFDIFSSNLRFNLTVEIYVIYIINLPLIRSVNNFMA